MVCPFYPSIKIRHLSDFLLFCHFFSTLLISIHLFQELLTDNPLETRMKAIKFAVMYRGADLISMYSELVTMNYTKRNFCRSKMSLPGFFAGLVLNKYKTVT